MGTIENVWRTGAYVLAFPPRKLKELRWPADVRVPKQGDVLEVRRPDGSVVFGTVGLWGVYGQKEGRLFLTTSDPADPEVSVMIDGIAEDELWPGSEIWIQAYPVRAQKQATDAEGASLPLMLRRAPEASEH